jgi:hypothetical protein
MPPKKQEKRIKAWAIIFPKSKDIYETLSDGFPMGQKAIFSNEKSAKYWLKKWSKDEAFKPKVVPCQIILSPKTKR